MSVAAITEMQFWGLIETIDWAKRSKENFDEGKRFIMSLITPEEAEIFGDAVRRKQGELARHLDAYAEREGVEFGLGDDGWGDFTGHIVGLGRVEYDRVMADPSLGLERARKYDFVESFSYILPFASDYTEAKEQDEIGALRIWAEQLLATYMAAEKLPVDQPALGYIRTLLRLIGLVADGDVERFLASVQTGTIGACGLSWLMTPTADRSIPLYAALCDPWPVLELYTDCARAHRGDHAARSCTSTAREKDLVNKKST